MAEWLSGRLGPSPSRNYNSWYFLQLSSILDQQSKFFGKVRDWHYPHDAPFGGEGGELVLQRLLAADEDQPLEVEHYPQNIVNARKTGKKQNIGSTN